MIDDPIIDDADFMDIEAEISQFLAAELEEEGDMEMSKSSKPIKGEQAIAQRRGKASVQDVLDLICIALPNCPSGRLSAVLRFLRERYSKCKNLKSAYLRKAFTLGVRQGLLVVVAEAVPELLPSHLQAEGGDEESRYDTIYKLSVSYTPHANTGGSASGLVRSDSRYNGMVPQSTAAAVQSVSQTGRFIDCMGTDGRIIKRFRSLDEVRLAGLSADEVLRCLQGRKDSAHGMRWRYYEELSQAVFDHVLVSHESINKRQSLKAVGGESDVEKDYGSELEEEDEDHIAVIDIYSKVGKKGEPLVETKFCDDFAADPLMLIIFTAISSAVRTYGANLFEIFEVAQARVKQVSKHSVVAILRRCVACKVLIESYRPPDAVTPKGGRGHGRRAHAHLYYCVSAHTADTCRWGVEVVGLDGGILQRYTSIDDMSTSLSIKYKTVYDSCCGIHSPDLGELRVRVFYSESVDDALMATFVSNEEILSIIDETKLLPRGSQCDYSRSVPASSSAAASGLDSFGFRKNRRQASCLSVLGFLTSPGESRGVDQSTLPVQPPKFTLLDADRPHVPPEEGMDYQVDVCEQAAWAAPQCDESEADQRSAPLVVDDDISFQVFCSKARVAMLPLGFIFRLPLMRLASSTSPDTHSLCFGCVVGYVRNNSIIFDYSDELELEAIVVFDGQVTVAIPVDKLPMQHDIVLEVWNENSFSEVDALSQIRQEYKMKQSQIWVESEVRSYFRINARMVFDQRNKFQYLFRLSLLSKTRGVAELVAFHFQYWILSSQQQGRLRLLSIFRASKAARDGSFMVTDLVPALFSLDSVGGAFDPLSEPLPSPLPAPATNDNSADNPWDIFFGVKYCEDPKPDSADAFGSSVSASFSSNSLTNDLYRHDDGATTRKRRAVEMFDLSTDKMVRRFPSGKSASDALGIQQGYISCCCRGVKEEAGGFGWRFVDSDVEVNFQDPDFVSIEDLIEQIKNNPRIRKRHSSSAAAASAPPMKTGRESEDDKKDSVVERRKKKPVDQISLLTNEVEFTFPSAVAAAKHHGYMGLQQRISLCCRGKIPHAHGFKWRFSSAGSDLDNEGISGAGSPTTKKRKLDRDSYSNSSSCACASRWKIHKSMFVLVLEAIMFLQDSSGSSLEAIRAYILVAYPQLEYSSRLLKVALRRCLEHGVITKTKTRFTLTDSGMQELSRVSGGRPSAAALATAGGAMNTIISDLKRSWIPVSYHVFQVMRSIAGDASFLSIQKIREAILNSHPGLYTCSTEDEKANMEAGIKAACDSGVEEALYVCSSSDDAAYGLTELVRNLIRDEEKLIGNIGISAVADPAQCATAAVRLEHEASDMEDEADEDEVALESSDESNEDMNDALEDLSDEEECL